MLREVEKYFARKANGKVEKARKALRKSSNPLVAWIGGRDDLFTETYVYYTEQVLRLCPLTREQLEQYGTRNYLGSEFTAFVRAAAAAGVWGTVQPTTSTTNTGTVDVEALVNDLATAYGFGGDAVKGRIRDIVTRHVR